MRYFIVQYVKKADGKIDEVVSTSRYVRRNDMMSANVILDFKQRSVEKCYVNNAPNINRDWNFLVDYYSNFYSDIIQTLEKTAA